MLSEGGCEKLNRGNTEHQYSKSNQVVLYPLTHNYLRAQSFWTKNHKR